MWASAPTKKSSVFLRTPTILCFHYTIDERGDLCFRKGRKCERNPSGVPFAFNSRPQAARSAKQTTLAPIKKRHAKACLFFIVFSLHYRWTWRFMFSERKKVWKEPIRGSFRVQFPPTGGTVCEADHTRTNKEKTRQSVSFLYWCERWDLNSHDGCHTPLKRACLPIPALSHTISDCSVIILTAFVFVKCFISFWPDVPSQMSSI